MPVLDLKTMKVEGRGFKEKVKKIGRDVKTKSVEIGRWCMDHPQETIGILTGVGVVVGGVAKVTKGAIQHHAIRMERFNKERYIYDHSLHAYLKLKRPLKSNDVTKINAIRRKTGEKLSEVLARMNLLD